MTFYEAALEVLRDEGRPLHFKKITAHAIKRNLLSHVGRTPEDTMEDRLTQETQKPESESLIRAVRPGVFSLVEGANVAEARQTVSPRTQVAEDDDDQPAEHIAREIVDEQNGHDEAVNDGAESSPANDRSRNGRTRANDDRSRTAGHETSARGDSGRTQDRNGRGGRKSSNGRRDQDSRDGDSRPKADAGASQSTPQDEPKSSGTAASRKPSANDRSDNRPETRSDDRSSDNRQASTKSDPRTSDNRRASAKSDKGTQRTDSSRQSEQASPENSDVIGALATQIAGILEGNGAMPLDKIVDQLSGTAWAALREFGSVAVRNVMIHANEQCGTSGQPPRFFELNNHCWTLSQASDKRLAESYRELEQWQNNHRALLLDKLTSQLARMSHGKISVTVGMIMERLGYDDITVGKQVGEEVTNLVGTLERGFTNDRVVIRVLRKGSQANAESVISFRGSLNLYRADRGILVSIDGFEDEAREHQRVDNLAAISLVSAEGIARLMLDTGVGVSQFQLSTACIDDAFFAS